MKNNDLLLNEFSAFKLLNFPERINSLVSVGDCFPVTIEIDLTNYCNHKCKCCVDPVHGKEKLDPVFIEILFDELKELGIKAVVLKGGGESIIHPEFEKIVQCIGDKGFDLGIVTNGSRLVNDSISKVLCEYAHYVRVSFNGSTQESYRNMHGVDEFCNTKEGVKKLIGYRARKNPIVGLSFPFDIHNIHEVYDAINLIDELNADYILIRPFFYEEVGYSRQMNTEQSAEVRKVLVDASQAYAGDKKIIVGQFISDFEYNELANKQAILESSGRNAYNAKKSNGIEHEIKRCYAHPLITAITADRHVWGCCNLRNYNEYSFGQIDYNKGITFEKIWKGQKRCEVRNLIDNAKCLKYCTHALGRYNEFLHYKIACDKNHGSFL